MLVRLVVVVMCVAWASGELQCNGPGRFSTTPGMCTSEYYTCSRDANKEYVAYVLSCPGNTLFNERTRKCSNAKTVSCIHPLTSTPYGQIKLTHPRRQKVTSGQTSTWISRPEYGFELTTKRQLVEYRKPGRLPWVTPRPHFTTPTPMMRDAKPQKSQWRIRVSTTKRKTLTTSREPLVSPPKIMTQRRTYSHSRRKSTTTPKNVTRKVYTVGKIHNSSTNLVEVKPVSTSTLSSISQQPNINGTTGRTLSANQAEFSTAPDVMSTNIYPNSSQTPAGTLSSPTSSTQTMNVILDGPLSENYKTQITPNLLTHSIVTPTSLQISSVENIFATTPEAIIKNGKSSVPFMDVFEPSEHNADLEIVDVVFNSNSNFMKPTDTHSKKHSDTPIKYISYFYDPDSDNHKIKHKKHRQPKMGRVRNEN